MLLPLPITNYQLPITQFERAQDRCLNQLGVLEGRAEWVGAKILAQLTIDRGRGRGQESAAGLMTEMPG